MSETCDRLLDSLLEHIKEPAPSPAGREAMEHAQTCPECAATVASYRGMLKSLGQAGDLLSDDVAARVLVGIQGSSPDPSVTAPEPVVAGAVVVGANIAALELGFARSPTLDACIPLCESYLAQERFMEAMVVAKKGIKQAPGDPRGPVLLARVFLGQGKLKKAEKELGRVLDQHPGYAGALEVLGHLRMLQGLEDQAVVALRQAVAADPSLTRAREMLAGLGAEVEPVSPMPAPPAQPPPSGLPQPGALGVQPGEEAPKLEHVTDFFADDTLGFGDDGTHIETAGPGRLTILGFIPKSTGSIKTTIAVAVSLFVLAGVVVTTQYISSESRRVIARYQGQMKTLVDTDTFAGYRDAVEVGARILEEEDGEEVDTLAAMAYAEAILAHDHAVEGSLDRAKHYVQRCVAAKGENVPNLVAARILLARHERRYEDGLAEIDRVKRKGGTATVFEIEAYALMAVARSDAKETKRQRVRLADSLTYHARGYTVLGWDHYRNEQWAPADRSFDEALKNSKDHPSALLGQALTDLDRNIGIEERQREIEQKIKKVHALPKENLSKPVLALAHFARAQLYQWQKNTADAKVEYEKAFALEPGNPLFYVARARGRMNVGRWTDALGDLREAGKLEPNNPWIFQKTCRAYTQAKRFGEATAACARARELGATEARYLDCERLREAGDYGEALSCHLGIPIQVGADVYAQAQIAASKVMRAQKQWNKAALHMTEFLEKMPGGVQPPRIAEAWCELGQAYEGGKKKGKAIDCYSYGVEQYPFQAECHAYLCFAMPNREAETKEACKRYLKVAPRGHLVDQVERRMKKLR